MRKRNVGLFTRLLVPALILLPVWVPLLVGKLFDKQPNQAELADAGLKQTIRPEANGEETPLRGEVELIGRARIQHAELRRQLKHLEPARNAISISNKDGGSPFLIVAPGVDAKLHVPNAYLLARPPYRVKQAWMPLYAVAERLRYQLDHHQFSGREEVWLTSLQAWNSAFGDCEDHAVLLADWLIDLGLDARVVIGKHRSEGHAWVIVMREGKQYLLEATDKRKLLHWSFYPLAARLPDYHPEAMFNRQTLWVNTGSRFITQYDTANWQQVMRFKPYPFAATRQLSS